MHGKRIQETRELSSGQSRSRARRRRRHDLARSWRANQFRQQRHAAREERIRIGNPTETEHRSDQVVREPAEPGMLVAAMVFPGRSHQVLHGSPSARVAGKVPVRRIKECLAPRPIQ